MVLLFLLLLGLVMVTPASAATWREVLNELRNEQAGLAAGEVLWVEQVLVEGGRRYKVWKRPVSKDSVTAFYKEIWYAETQDTQANFNWLQSDGTSVPITIIPNHTGPRSAGGNNRTTINFSCNGRQMVPGPDLIWTPGTQFWCLNAYCWVGGGVITGTSECSNTDTLIYDTITAVTGSCDPTLDSVTTTPLSGYGSFSVVELANCACIPDGYAISGRNSVTDKCEVRRVIGDPSAAPAPTPGQLATEVAGRTSGFTGTPPSTGDFQTPLPGTGPVVAADQNPPGANTPVGARPGPGAQSGSGAVVCSTCTGVADGAPGGTSQLPGWSGGTSGATLGGEGTATVGQVAAGVKQAVKEALEETGSTTAVPSAPSYDATVETPEENDIVALVTGFLSSNPLIGIITGTRIEASAGSCSMSVSIWNRNIVFDFCPYQSFVQALGLLVLGAAGLYSVLIAFGAT